MEAMKINELEMAAHEADDTARQMDLLLSGCRASRKRRAVGTGVQSDVAIDCRAFLTSVKELMRPAQAKESWPFAKDSWPRSKSMELQVWAGGPDAG
eukprot:781094-Pelagomonas_calceolata.AAC.5